MKRISETTYRIQRIGRGQVVVHFDRLKRYVPGTQFDTENGPPRTTPVSPPYDTHGPPGTHLELVDDEHAVTAPTETTTAVVL